MNVILENDLDLPDGIFDLLCAVHDDYDSGNSDFTATGLTRTPMQHFLSKQDHELVIPMSKKAAVLIGSLAHKGLEHYAEVLAEQAAHKGARILAEPRFYHDFIVDGAEYRVSAQIDLLAWAMLSDYKFLKEFAAKKMPNDDYEFQAQLGLYLARQNGHDIDQTGNLVFVKDYGEQSLVPPVFFMPYKPWSENRVVLEVENRIEGLLELRPCTDEERWAIPERWSIIKIGGQRGTNAYTQDEANALLRKRGKGYESIYYPATYKKCTLYCDFCSVCPQMNGDK